MSLTKLWVDDLRPPPDEGWVWVKTSHNALLVLDEVYYEEMSLDHDLGDDDTTRPIVLWLCEHPWAWPKVVVVHTSNPPGGDWLMGMCQRYAPDGVFVHRRFSFPHK